MSCLRSLSMVVVMLHVRVNSHLQVANIVQPFLSVARLSDGALFACESDCLRSVPL